MAESTAKQQVSIRRFRYTPRGDSQYFVRYFDRLKESAQARFNDELVFDTTTMLWDEQQHCVVLTYPVGFTPELQTAVDNYIFGFFEALGF